MKTRGRKSISRHTDDPQAIVLAVVRDLACDLHPSRKTETTVGLDTQIVQELGFDSLARVELLARLEKELGVSLPEQVLFTVETPRDLVRALSSAAPPPEPIPVGKSEARHIKATEAEPVSSDTLVAVLDWQVRTHPERPHIHLLTEAGVQQTLTYAALKRGAEAVAAGLREHDLQPGQGVAIMLPTGREYFFSFYGVLLAGGIPVPIYPPARLSQIEEHLRRHARILANASTGILITVPEAGAVARLLRAQVPELRTITTVDELGTARVEQAGVRQIGAGLREQDIAFLQYTSGSTGNPKGVILTHANLLANIRAMGQAIRADSTDVFVSWLPLYHDMGLIGAWLGSLYYAVPLYITSPLTFLAHPASWLRAVHRYRATLTAGPNFAFELCLNKIAERDIEGLDLSSLRILFNGAEPVSPDTIRRFGARFAPYGLRPEALTPVYGLAESSVGLSFPPLGRGAVIDRIQRKALTSAGKAIPAEEHDAGALEFVGCGHPLPGHQIRIVDATGHEVGEREEGRLEFMGPSATSGYFRNPQETRRLFHDGWLDSGDRAYLANGEVFVTGRIKDIIIRSGRNIYPQELEQAIGCLTGIRKGCVAVFGAADPKTKTERLVILAETRETDRETLEHLYAEINAVTADLIGAPPDDIVLAPPRTVLKTSSGKIRRAASRLLYEQGQLGGRRQALWRQFARLARAAVIPEWRRLRRACGAILYAAYAWMLFWTLAPLVWTVVALIPRPSWNLKIIGAAARALIRLSGTRLHLHGMEHLPTGPYVLVSNHASYLDGIVLTAVLPGVYSYVAKRELARQFIARVFLRRIESRFVERFDLQRGVADARQLVNTVRAGRALVFFPEGTFERMPGLAPFHLGAFVTAADAGVPVVPVAIRGTRSMLRADHWFPRAGTVSLTFGRPLSPAAEREPESSWQSAIELRDKSRTMILKHCGEPDLAYRPQPV